MGFAEPHLDEVSILRPALLGHLTKRQRARVIAELEGAEGRVRIALLVRSESNDRGEMKGVEQGVRE